MSDKKAVRWPEVGEVWTQDGIRADSPKIERKVIAVLEHEGETYVVQDVIERLGGPLPTCMRLELFVKHCRPPRPPVPATRVERIPAFNGQGDHIGTYERTISYEWVD